jgi:hypothetical protein
LFQSKEAEEEFTLFSIEDVDKVFENFVQLKYQQRHLLTGKGQGIEVLAYPAGRMSLLLELPVLVYRFFDTSASCGRRC